MSLAHGGLLLAVMALSYILRSWVHASWINVNNCPTRSNSSSSMALQLWSSLGILINTLPFKAVLDLFCPLHKLHLLQVILDIFPTGLGSSCWSTCEFWWKNSNKMQQLRFLFAMALLYMFRVTISPIIRSTMLYMATGKLAHLGCY